MPLSVSLYADERSGGRATLGWQFRQRLVRSLTRIGSGPAASPVGVRPGEPPQDEGRTEDQQCDFEHGHHVETPSPGGASPYAWPDTQERALLCRE